MQISIPVFYSAHHASASFGKYDSRCALTQEQKLRFSDLGTGDTVPQHTGLFLNSEYSRGVVDLNRDKNDLTSLFHKLDFGRQGKHKVWKDALELKEEEKREIVRTVYDPYHKNILTAIQKFDRPGVIVAWDNTASYESGYVVGSNPDGSPKLMHPIVLSNNGDRESGDAVNKEVLTCSPEFLEELAYELKLALRKRGLVDEVHLNTYYYFAPNDECGYIANRYNTFRKGNNLTVSQPVHSFQIEYDTSITHDLDSLKPNVGKVEKLKSAFEEAMENTYANLLTWNIGVT